MSFRNKREQGGKLPQDHRTGVGQFPPLRGVKKSKNPGSLADSQFDHLQNVRIKRGVIRERGGLVKGATNAFPGVQGFYDATDIGAPFTGDYVPPPPLLAYAMYSISNAGASGAWFSQILPGEDPTRIVLPTLGIATFARPFQSIAKIMVGNWYTPDGTPSDDEKPHLYQWDPDLGVELVFTPPQFQATGSRQYGMNISSGVEFDGNFYFSVWSVKDDLGLPYDSRMQVYRWDGVLANPPVLEVDVTFQDFWGGGFNAYLNIGTYNSWGLYSDGLDVYAICKPASGAEGQGSGSTPGNLIKKRNGGAWDTLSMPGGYTVFGESFTPLAISYGALVRYDGDTYICGTHTALSTKKLKILKVVGSSVEEVWTRTNSTMAGNVFLFTADDVLYYSYTDPGSSIFRTGSFDGATWDDTFKTWPSNRVPTSVVDFDGELWSAGMTGLNQATHTVDRDVGAAWVDTSIDPESDYGIVVDVTEVP